MIPCASSPMNDQFTPQFTNQQTELIVESASWIFDDRELSEQDVIKLLKFAQSVVEIVNQTND